MSVDELYSDLRERMLAVKGPVQVRVNTEAQVELAGTIEVMQGKQKVDGHYIASIVKKPADVRFYFLPIYTHVDAFKELPEGIAKRLKGKSCFHIKKSDAPELHHISDLLQKGVELYQKDGLI